MTVYQEPMEEMQGLRIGAKTACRDNTMVDLDVNTSILQSLGTCLDAVNYLEEKLEILGSRITPVMDIQPGKDDRAKNPVNGSQVKAMTTNLHNRIDYLIGVVNLYINSIDL